MRETDTGEWPQCVIEFADRQTAEEVAWRTLRPALTVAEAEGVIARWFFIRKAPYWRLRYWPAKSDARQYFAQLLDRLASEGQIVDWTAGVYEPEVPAFGGPAGMGVAHDLFHHDSRRILDHLAMRRNAAPDTPGLGSRELAILLCSVLMRGARQDWYEQGDVWVKVAQHRPDQGSTSGAGHLKPATHRLMTIDAGPTSKLFSRAGPLGAVAEWAAAFGQAGEQLADLARRGTLDRGLRAVLAHHVIFHWNRLGLSYAEQNTLATLTSEVVMGSKDGGASMPETGTGDLSVAEVKTQTTEETTTAEAGQLRDALVDQLRDQGTVRTGRVEAALRVVPRHLFVPGVPLEQAYADDPVYTKHDDAGVSISAASQPTIVAMMLEQLQAEPGQRILEIGAGTGYNAGLIAHLVGDQGKVTAIDVDDDIVEGARAGLTAAGIENVHVVLADGALGHAANAPFDRIIATVGAGDLPDAWLEQLAPDGRLVVPLRLRGSVSRSIVFERDSDRWRSRSSQMCAFMPLRGIADDARRVIALTSDGSVTLQANQEQTVDAAALTGVLDTPSSQVWTGVLFGAAESFEWLDLWLTCTMDNALSRMPADRPAIDSGLVNPQFGWGAMAVTDKNNLAYLTLRPVERAEEVTARTYEVGIIGHGPGGEKLAGQVADAIRAWDKDYRSRHVQFEIQPADVAESIEQVPGRSTFERRRTRLAITWH